MLTLVTRPLLPLLACLGGLCLPFLAPLTAMAATLEGEPFSLPPAQLLEIARAPLPDPEQPAVFLRIGRQLDFDADQKLTEVSHQIYRIDSAAAVPQWGQIFVPWDPTRQQRPRIRARVITADGIAREFDSSTLTDAGTDASDPLIHSDIRLLRAPLPAVAVGSVIETEVIIVDAEPQFGAGRVLQIPFVRPVPVVHTRVVVTAPAAIPLRHALSHAPEARAALVRRGGRQELTVEQGPIQLDRTQFLEAAGEGLDIPRLTVSTGGSWAAIARSYEELTAPAVQPEQVRSVLPATLPAGRNERIAALLKVLHTRVRYTGVLLGQAKLTPQPPAVTLQRGYGDCKDKAVLLISMLRALDIPAQLALVNASTGPDLDPVLPGIGAFNHVLVYLPGAPDLWIDATAEYHAVDELPFADRGRWALLVGPGGESLRRTPAATTADSRIEQDTEFRLADQGSVEVHATLRLTGGASVNMRGLLAADASRERATLDETLGRIFDAKKVRNLEVVPDDGRGPLTIRADLENSSLGWTSFTDASVKLRLADLFQSLPLGLRMSAGNAGVGPADEDAQSPSPQERTIDWVFEPYSAEWRLRIVPPAGFRPGTLPESTAMKLGPATLSQHYQADPAGTITGTIRVDTGSGRYTVTEAAAFREAFLALQGGPALEVRFDHEASALMSAGDAAGALRRHEQLVADHPRQAIHYVRWAGDLLAVGLVEEARKAAQRAIDLAPVSSHGFGRLGWILQHDALGRRWGRGFDRDGALRAFREGLRHAPDDTYLHSSLASTLERGNDGSLYGPGADLAGAIEQYRWLLVRRPRDKEASERLMFCLLHAGRFADIPAVAGQAANSSMADSMRLAARVMTDGPAAGWRAASNDARDGEIREDGVYAAVDHLIRVRRYDEARALIEVARQGTPEGSAQQAKLRGLKKLRRTDDLPAPPDTATGTVERLMRMMFRGPPDPASLLPLLSAHARLGKDARWLADNVSKFGAKWHRFMQYNSSYGSDVATDLLLSGLEYHASSPSQGPSRVSVMLPGWPLGNVYVVPESGSWRILALSFTRWPLGRAALASVDAGDLAGARQWIDWALEDEAQMGSQSASASLLARAYPPGTSPTDTAALRLAAYVLLLDNTYKTSTVEAVRKENATATTAQQKLLWDAVLAEVASQEGDRATMLAAAERVAATEPGSEQTHRALGKAYYSAERWGDLERLQRNRLETHPNDWQSARMLRFALTATGRGEEAYNLLRTAVDNGQADALVLNEFAWQAVFLGRVDEAAVSAARRANSQQPTYAIAHTLACVLAEVGPVTEARRVLLAALDQESGFDAENSSVWLVPGLIAERVGAREAAVRAYQRVTPKDGDRITSAHAIAQARLARLLAEKVRVTARSRLRTS